MEPRPNANKVITENFRGKGGKHINSCGVCVSVVEHLPCACEAQGLVLSTTKMMMMISFLNPFRKMEQL